MMTSSIVADEQLKREEIRIIDPNLLMLNGKNRRDYCNSTMISFFLLNTSIGALYPKK